MKKLTALLLALLIVLGTLCTGALANSDDYIVIDGVLMKYTGAGTDIVIPEGVTEIAAGVFTFRQITSLTFPSTLKVIGEDAFFGSWGSLRAITIPASIEKIGIGAFRGNTGDHLENILVDAGNKYFKSEDGVLMSKDGKELICYPSGKTATTYAIPETVEVIKNLAMANTILESVTIPSSVRIIEPNAFYVSALKELTIPATVEWMDTSAIDYCEDLTKLVIESKDTKVEDGSFFGADKMTVYAPEESPVKRLAEMYGVPFEAIENTVPAVRKTAESTLLYYIPGVSQFYHADPNCRAVSMTHKPLPASFTLGEANDEAYRGLKPCKACGAPKRLPAQESAAAVPAAEAPAAEAGTPAKMFEYAMKDDFTLTITKADKSFSDGMIPSELDGYKITEIGDSAFEMNDKLTSVVIPEGITRLGNYAFRYTSNLKEITIPDTVTYLGSQLFFSSGITSLKIPAGVRTIEDGIFDWCECLKSIEVDPANPVFEMRGNLLVNKEKNAIVYHLDTDKGTYTVSDEFEKIGPDAFFNNASMKEIIIPDSVKEIESGAFFQCRGLETVRLPEGLKEIGYMVFCQCISLKNITIPESVERIETCAFCNNASLKELVIPAGVTYIAKDAFEECEDLAIKAPAGSYAQKYCEENGIKFIELGNDANG